MFFAPPIPATYASLFYLYLGATLFLIALMGFAGSVAVALVQFPGGYLEGRHGRRWLIVSMTFGLAVGTLLIGFLYAYVSPQLPFLLLAASAIPLSIFVFWRVYEPNIKEA